MEARGDKDVFPSSSLLREYVSLEGCKLHLARLTQLHTCLTLFSDELHHKGLVHLPLLESLKAESGAFTIELEAHTHNQIGGSQTHHKSVTTNNIQVRIKVT